MNRHGTDWHAARREAYRLGRSIACVSEAVALDRAAGRTLAAPVRALTDVPRFSNSAMDGWAVAGEAPWVLGPPVRAGDPPDETPMAPGSARPIVTGAAVPAGTRAVLRAENGHECAGRNGEPTLLFPSPACGSGDIAAGRHVREAGEEVRSGETVLRAGDILTPPRVGLAAVCGVDQVEVAAIPRVALAFLGREVVRSGIPRVGAVRDAFGPQFPAVVRSMGAEAVSLVPVADELDATMRAVGDAEAELVITTGGSAGGAHDHIRSALERLGAEVLVESVAMRPGHPVVIARLGDRAVLCLPGNPLAAMVTMASFGPPIVDGMLRRPQAALGRVALGDDIPNASPVMSVVCYVTGPHGARPTPHQDPAMLRGLSAADGLMLIPPGGLRRGDAAVDLRLPW